MFVYIFTIIIIIALILTNAVTDAPNAISTIVGTKTMDFKKAAKLSAIFNFIGIVLMSFVNISVAECISSMVNLDDGINGMLGLACAITGVVIFAIIAMQFGIPTSETHGLVAGLTGSGLAIYGIKAINWGEWKNVLIGLAWSILGTYIISKILVKILKKKFEKMKEKNIEKAQIFGCIGMSFMHGAQDGQKFIGVLIIMLSIMKGTQIGSTINPSNYVLIIFIVAILMAIGVSIGGKKIVDNIGSDMVVLNKKEALISDIATVITLVIASLTGLPVSTTHAKTVSIIGVGKSNNAKMSHKKISSIFKAWIYTFPICGGISYLLAIIATKII